MLREEQSVWVWHHPLWKGVLRGTSKCKEQASLKFNLWILRPSGAWPKRWNLTIPPLVFPVWDYAGPPGNSLMKSTWGQLDRDPAEWRSQFVWLTRWWGWEQGDLLKPPGVSLSPCLDGSCRAFLKHAHLAGSYISSLTLYCTGEKETWKSLGWPVVTKLKDQLKILSLVPMFHRKENQERELVTQQVGESQASIQRLLISFWYLAAGNSSFCCLGWI